MNLPAAWGVYQSKPGGTPSNDRGEERGEGRTSYCEQQVHDQ